MTNRSIACLALVMAGCGAATRATPAARPGPVIVAGPAFAEIASDGAVLWARADGPGYVHVALEGAHDARSWTGAVDTRADGTVRIALSGLVDRTQPFRAWVSASGAPETAPTDAVRGTLTLAPPAAEASAVTFGFGGDIGGGAVCRDRDRGWPLVTEAASEPHDFFVMLGDQIYADQACGPVGRYGNPQVEGDFARSTTLEAFRAHYRYAEADAGFAALRARSYAVWDDHETMNDAGPTSDTRRGSDHLLPLGRVAFGEHTPGPVAWAESADAPLYRSARWGRHLELFFLDTRSYRDPNLAMDDGETPKSLLGATQRDWLVAALAQSDATWRVVVSSVPMGIPTGRDEENDGWADGGSGRGYERELRAIFEAAHDAGIRQLVFLTTDLHFATTLRYRPLDDDPTFVVHELVTGPMAAGLSPTRELDETFHPERLFFHGPEDSHAVTTLDAALAWSTWGLVRVGEDGGLHYEVRSIERTTLFQLDL